MQKFEIIASKIHCCIITTTSISFFFFNNCFPTKPPKEGLGNKFKKLDECPTSLSQPSSDQSAVINFLIYARNVPTNKKSKTSAYLVATF